MRRKSLILLAVALLVGAVPPAPAPLPEPPIVTVNGATTGYAFGCRVGEALHDRAIAFYASNTWADDMRILYHTGYAVKGPIDTAMARHRTMFPELMAEIDGMAFALNKSSVDVFIDNIAPEIDQWMYANGGWPDVPRTVIDPAARNARGTGIAKSYARVVPTRAKARLAVDGHFEGKKCTDLMVATANTFAHGHNEDWDRITAPFMAILVTRDFTSYNYPGDFVGTSFLANKWGLTLGMNSIYPNVPGSDWDHSYGLSFLLRQVAVARTIDQVVLICKSLPIYSGYSINVMSVCDDKAVNIEAYGNEIRVRQIGPTVSPGRTVHMNEYMDLKVDQWTGGDSSFRLRCYNRWTSSFDSPEGIRAFLGDPNCPVWRWGSETDASTMTEWIANGKNRTILAFNAPYSATSYVPAFHVFPWSITCVNSNIGTD